MCVKPQQMFHVCETLTPAMQATTGSTHALGPVCTVWSQLYNMNMTAAPVVPVAFGLPICVSSWSGATKVCMGRHQDIRTPGHQIRTPGHQGGLDSRSGHQIRTSGQSGHQDIRVVRVQLLCCCMYR